MSVNLPGSDERLLIVGRTGSGKTYAALWHLSQVNFTEIPWIIIDFKGDKNINSIPLAEYITPDKPPPAKPGIFILRLQINQQADLEAFLWQVYARENIGLFIDEGYMIGTGSQYSPAFRAILTQGRSKQIPVIINSQRPKWLDVFTVSEADKLQVYHLNVAGDKKAIRDVIGEGYNVDKTLAPYHSIYYDVSTDTSVEFSPVPDARDSIALINERLVLLNQSYTDNLADAPAKPRKL